MQIDGMYLLPQMSSTNSAATGADVIKKEATFQSQLQAATKKLETPAITRSA